MLRNELARSLRKLPELDRLAAAWPVACGPAMAAHAHVVGFAENVVQVEVDSEPWLRQILSMRGQIAQELAKVAGVSVHGVHFEGKSRRRM